MSVQTPSMPTGMTTKKIRQHKHATSGKYLQMLTCYDFQTAQMLSETALDMILVGDSLGNVILGHSSTLPVTVQEMEIFGAAVKRGAPHKFVVVDMPFGSYATLEIAIRNVVRVMQKTNAEAVKIEGASPVTLKLIQRLVDNGVPVMGHIGLIPQSVHELGGYYIHGKTKEDQEHLINQAVQLAKAGCFSIVLECIQDQCSQMITNEISIPTIGIGAGPHVDGKVLVLNDLLGMGKTRAPKFCTPIANQYATNKQLLEKYLSDET